MQVASGTKVRFSTGTIGPSHDPYGRSTLRVWRRGYLYTLEENGLGFCRFSIDGKAFMETPHYDAESIEQQFAHITGARPDQWVRWYETRVCQPDPMDSYYGF